MSSITFPVNQITGAHDMPDDEKPQERKGVLEWLKWLTQLGGIITIASLLISLGTKIQGYQYEVASCNKTTARILEIYQKQEDAGRAAIDAEIRRLEMDLTPYTPVQRRRKTEELIQALKEKLKTSRLIPPSDVAGGEDYSQRN